MTTTVSARRAHGKRGGVLTQVIAGALPLAALNACDPIERVQLVKDGVPAALLVFLADELAVSRERLYATLGLPRATADRKVRGGERLDADAGERALGLARLVGQVEQTVRESGDSTGFDAGRWTAAWLERPHPALGGRRPGELMDTAEGRGLVSDLVARMQSGAYA